MARRNSKFDSIRNTLLSKVTNPLQQLELITVAIIYKLIFIENDQLIRLSSKSLLVRQESSEKYHWITCLITQSVDQTSYCFLKGD